MRILPLVLTLLVGLGVAAVQLIPTLAFVSRSTRAGLDYEGVSWGFPLAQVSHLLYPGYFGSSPQYVGILSPVLASAALLMRRARRQVIFWIAVGTVAFVLSFGGHTFFYNLFYLLAPGFGVVRNQERVIYLFSFAVSVLAGYGALVLVQPLPRRMRARFTRFGRGLVRAYVVLLTLTGLFYFGYLLGVQQGVTVNMFEGVLRHHTLLVLILSAAVTIFWLRRSGRVSRRWLVALTLGAIWLNLFTINWRFNLADPVPGGPFPESDLVRFLQRGVGTSRISSAGLLPGGASAGIVYQLEDITGNTPLRLHAFQQFEDRLGDWRRWQLLNVGYVLDRRDLDGPGLERVFEDGEVKVYEVGDPMARAWIVHCVEVAADDLAFDRLNATEFDPRAMAVLPPESGAATQPQACLEHSVGISRGDQVQIVGRRAGRLVLDLSTGDPGLLVVSQPFYPGWQAMVDGTRVPILRVNCLLQGISIEPGSHRVELVYRMSSWPAVLSLVTLVSLALILLRHGRKRRG